MLKKIRTEITYKVPAWEYCNLVVPGKLSKPSKQKCRFCVKESGGYLCALYNEALLVEQVTMPKKCRSCVKATAGFKSEVTDVDDAAPTVDPKLLIQTTLAEYDKLCKQLKSQGYPTALAEKVAKEYLLGGN